jgi:predicted ester cyclase
MSVKDRGRPFGSARSAGGRLPDADVELPSVIEEADLVSFRLDGSGPHLGRFLGVEPTGKAARIQGIHHARLRDGRIVEHWPGRDILAMLSGMGMFAPGR